MAADTQEIVGNKTTAKQQQREQRKLLGSYQVKAKCIKSKVWLCIHGTRYFMLSEDWECVCVGGGEAEGGGGEGTR